MGEIKTINGHRVADAEYRAFLRGIKRKLLAITGGLYNMNKVLNTFKNDAVCYVSSVVEPSGSSTEEAVDIRCGHYAIKLRLRLEPEGAYAYRINRINGILFNVASVYTEMGDNRQTTLKEINIDNTVYDDFSALKVVDFEFKRLCLIYESTGTYIAPDGGDETEFTCTTTLCITPDGFTVAETVSDEAAAIAIPTAFIRNDNGAVKEKSIHGKRMVFSVSTRTEPPYPNTYFETVENDGCSTFKKISFGRCE